MIDTTSNPTAQSSSQASHAYATSFLTNHGSVGACFADALRVDQQKAKLSTSFQWYYRFRSFVPIAVRQLLQRSRNSGFELEEDWYIPRQFLSSLADAIRTDQADQSPREVAHPWPNGKQFCLSLSHDVETAYGMRLIEKMASIEEKHGVRSSWNLVPKKYPIDPGLVRDMLARGFEFGVHGYNHDGRLFSSERVFSTRARTINQVASQFEAVGFRAPMVHRNLRLIERDLHFEYDASCFDIDPLQAMPGGVGSIWPFIVGGKIVELPYTMPQDHTLFVSLGQTDTHVWQRKLQFLKRNCGMALMLTHPDYMDSPELLQLYDRFLGDVVERQEHWHALPRDVGAWWQEREAHVHRGLTSPNVRLSEMRAEGQEVRFELL